jgi:hypothetical protein
LRLAVRRHQPDGQHQRDRHASHHTSIIRDPTQPDVTSFCEEVVSLFAELPTLANRTGSRSRRGNDRRDLTHIFHIAAHRQLVRAWP